MNTKTTTEETVALPTLETIERDKIKFGGVTGCAVVLGHAKNQNTKFLLNLEEELSMAEKRAISSLSRYEFANFGYWAGTWVLLNRLTGSKRPSPFKELVNTAQALLEKGATRD